MLFLDTSAKKSKSKESPLGYLAMGISPVLYDHRGNSHPIAKDTLLRLAHPVDLFETGEWLAWKSKAVTEQRQEPIPQMSRPFFAPTSDELSRSAKQSTFANNKDSLDQDFESKGRSYGVIRFADAEHNSDQFAAILLKMGWSNGPYDELSKRWNEYRAIAICSSDPSGVSSVCFYRLDSDSELVVVPVNTVPPRVFSEALWEVSRAVTGSELKKAGKSQKQDNVPNEEMISMRIQLLRELILERKLKNVTIVGTTATIHGKLDTYCLDIVTGDVVRKSGNVFFTHNAIITPVHEAFASIDEQNPGTTTCVSLVIHLANDHKIKEPTLIDQLR